MVFRLLKPSKSSHFFLFGARGTGKTWLLREIFPEKTTLYINLLRPADYQQLSLKPGLLRDYIAGRDEVTHVIVDEIQKVPALLDVVHDIIEDPTVSVTFGLTGSSARKLKRGGANLLAGRAFVYNLYPFSPRELKERFQLSEALSWGTLPRLYALQAQEDKREYLSAYALTYLREEVLEEQLVRKLEPFNRFLPIAAQTSGKIVNYSSIAKHVGVASKTVESYFHILADTLIGFFLPAFHPSVRKQERSAPKFYLFDLGVRRALAQNLDSDVSAGTYGWGDAFEHFILQEIVRLASYQRKQHQMFYYRTYGDLEIDLILQRGSSPPTLIEIKSCDQLSDDHLAHLRRITPDFPDSPAYCLSLDPRTRVTDGIRCMHWQNGLAELFPE